MAGFRKLFVTLFVALAWFAASTAPDLAQDKPKDAAPIEETTGDGGRLMNKGDCVPSGDPDFKLYKLKGRAWTYEYYEKLLTGLELQNTTKHVIKEVSEKKANCSRQIEFSAKSGVKNKKSDPDDYEVLFDASGAANVQTKASPSNDRKQWVYPDETIKVKAGLFECYVIQYGAPDSKGVLYYNLKWISKKYPGLLVQWETYQGKTELTAFKRDKDDKGGEKNPVTPRQLPPAGSDLGAPKGLVAPGPADWALFKQKGRLWTSINKTTAGGRDTVTYNTSEVTNTGADFAELKTQAFDEKKKPLMGMAPTTQRIAFTKENEIWVKPLATYKQVREEKLSLAGMEWDCLVFEDKSNPDSTLTAWMSKAFPGLWVKMHTKSKYSELTSELIETKGFPIPNTKPVKETGKPEVGKPGEKKSGPVADLKKDWVLFKKVGRKWKIKVGVEEPTYLTYEVVKLDGDTSCELRHDQLNSEGKSMLSEPDVSTVLFAEGSEIGHILPYHGLTKLRDEKISAAGIEWDCLVFEDKRVDSLVQQWWSRKYPGLVVKSYVKNRNGELTSILEEFVE